MEITEVKAHIQKRTFDPYYIFTGVEWKVQRLYIEQIAKGSGKELRYINSITDIYSKRNNTGFIQKSYVYVVRDDKEILQNEKVQSQLENIVGKNILIILLTSVDKRLKFYKTYKDSIVDFEPLKLPVIKKYIESSIHLGDECCEKLVEICEGDYGRCLLEIDKIKQYRAGYGADKIFDNDAFNLLLREGLIYTPPKDAIFDFVDAVLDADVNLAYELFRQCLEVGEATMVMISVLYNNAKATLQVKSCKSKDVSNSTGLTPWQINNAKKHTDKRSIGELLHIMKTCQRCQQSIVTGTMDEEFVMDYILSEVF